MVTAEGVKEMLAAGDSPDNIIEMSKRGTRDSNLPDARFPRLPPFQKDFIVGVYERSVRDSNQGNAKLVPGGSVVDMSQAQVRVSVRVRG